MRLRGVCIGGWMNMENFIDGYPGSEHGVRAAVAEAMGIDRAGRSDRELAAALAPAYDAFLRKVGLPIALSSDGLGEKDTQRLAEVTMSIENEPMRKANCRDVTAADAERFSREVLTAA